MAIQNFLSGGFYGKLGDVVGQRWHNKRIIRTHVIPFNPQTELQQANRQQFALATALAQEAYNVNKGDPLWDTSQMGQFSLMVGTAKRRLQAGMSPADALPLYPDGHVVDITLTNPSANWQGWGTSMVVSDNSYTFEQTREMEIIINCKNEMTGQPIFFDDVVTINSGSRFSYTFNRPNELSLPAGSTIQAASLNDAQHGGMSIQLPVFQLTQPSKPTVNFPVQFTQFVHHHQWDELEMTIPNMPLLEEEELEMDVYIYNYLDEEWYTWTTFPYSQDGNWIIWVPLSTDDKEARPGTHIVAGEQTLQRQTAFFRFIWPQFNFQYP